MMFIFIAKFHSIASYSWQLVFTATSAQAVTQSAEAQEELHQSRLFNALQKSVLHNWFTTYNSKLQ